MPNKTIVGGAAAGSGTSLAGALSLLIIKLWWSDADAETATALTTVVSALLAIPSVMLSVYFTKMETH